MYPIPEDVVTRCNLLLTDDLREIKDQFIEFIDKLNPVDSDLKR
jgi:hypothetical protein